MNLISPPPQVHLGVRRIASRGPLPRSAPPPEFESAEPPGLCSFCSERLGAATTQLTAGRETHRNLCPLQMSREWSASASIMGHVCSGNVLTTSDLHWNLGTPIKNGVQLMSVYIVEWGGEVTFFWSNGSADKRSCVCSNAFWLLRIGSRRW